MMIKNTAKGRAPLVEGVLRDKYKPAYLESHRAFAERERARWDREMVRVLRVMRKLERQRN